MNRTIILEDLLEHSVWFNGILIPARMLQSTLGKYCENLAVWTHHEKYKVQLLGTAIPIFYRDRHLLVCTTHQLRGVDPEDVCLLYADGSSAVTSSGIRAFKPNFSSESDAYDIAVFEFTEPLKEHPELRSNFLNFDKVPPDVTSDKVLALVTVGYPSSDQVYDIAESNHIGLVKRNSTAVLDGQPDDYALVRARFSASLEFDPDGLSGSPVFAIQLENGERTAYLAGMMVRAGNEFFHFLKVGFIEAFLDSTIADG